MTKENEPNQADEQLGVVLLTCINAAGMSVNFPPRKPDWKASMNDAAARFRSELMKSDGVCDDSKRLDFIADHVLEVTGDPNKQQMGIVYSRAGKRIVVWSDEDQHPADGLRQAIDRAMAECSKPTEVK